MDQPTATITIELTLDGDVPAGNARVDGGTGKDFHGWIGLVAALDEIVANLPSADAADGATAPSTTRRTT